MPCLKCSSYSTYGLVVCSDCGLSVHISVYETIRAIKQINVLCRYKYNEFNEDDLVAAIEELNIMGIDVKRVV